MAEPVRRREAADRAVSFLLDARCGAGWWRDFEVQGPSNLWVTGYVGAALARTSHPAAREAAARAWDLLADAQPEGRWSYHRGQPPDSDSVTWALRLAQELGLSRQPPAQRGYQILRLHVRPDDGLATYAMAVAGPVFEQVSFVQSWTGWLMSHPCVTAAAAALDDLGERPRLLSYLCRQQSADGGWPAYWWSDREYTAALACEALAVAGQAPDRVAAAARWAAGRVGPDGAVRTAIDPDGSPFATALAARALAWARRTGLPRDAVAARQRALTWLVRCQQDDGRWHRTARLRVVPPGVTDPDRYPGWGMDGRGRRSIGTIVVDMEGVFTTATVLDALAPDGDPA